MAGRKRKTYPQQSVLAYMFPGETYKQAEERLNLLWKQGKHPAQLKDER